MINFPCHCGLAFAVSDELAGGVVQCPKCKRLNDIPLLSDLQNIDEQGMYKIEPAEAPRNDPARVAKLTTLFTREHYDANGEPIDTRGLIGLDKGGPVPVESLGPLDAAAPKYDPITGELIRDIQIKPADQPAAHGIPLARAVIHPPTAIDGVELPKPYEALAIPIRLLRPVNLLVMFFIMLAQLLGAAMMTGIAAFNFMVLPFWVALHGLIVAHYANVIDETGPTSKSELPTPLRHVAWHEDTFGPFSRFFAALLVCYGPGILVLLNAGSVPPQILLPLSGAMTLLGTIAFPAALLSTTTSGSLLNLRPDRLVAVGYLCGFEYFVAVVTWAIAAPLLLMGTVGAQWLAAGLIQAPLPPAWLNPMSTWVGLLAGTYLMHAFCWHLGLLYRKHHAQFPWLYQRHIGRLERGRAMGFPVGRSPRRQAAGSKLPPKKSQSGSIKSQI